MKTGVMTNDSEQSAHDQLGSVDVAYPNDLDFVVGYDSGFGAKPNPDPLLAFAKKVSVEPDRCAMVGDSVHDLLAGRRAQMQTIGVLTGLATEADLSPYADLVLRDISHISCSWAVFSSKRSMPPFEIWISSYSDLTELFL